MTQSLEARPIVWKIVIRKYCDKGITISHWQFKKRLLFFHTEAKESLKFYALAAGSVAMYSQDKDMGYKY